VHLSMQLKAGTLTIQDWEDIISPTVLMHFLQCAMVYPCNVPQFKVQPHLVFFFSELRSVIRFSAV
jgi:hypothetical protein